MYKEGGSGGSSRKWEWLQKRGIEVGVSAKVRGQLPSVSPPPRPGWFS